MTFKMMLVLFHLQGGHPLGVVWSTENFPTMAACEALMNADAYTRNSPAWLVRTEHEAGHDYKVVKDCAPVARSG